MSRRNTFRSVATLGLLLGPWMWMGAADVVTPAAGTSPAVKKAAIKSAKADGSTAATRSGAAATPDAVKKPVVKAGTSKTPSTAKGTAKSASSQKITTVAKSHVTARPEAAKAVLVKTKTPVKAPSALSIKLTSAFLASTQLRPMAQQLASTRAVAAYAGVLSYAKAHPGEGAAAAYLALGHASMLDHKYADAAQDYKQANGSGEALDDYADYLGAQAALQAGHASDAYALLDRFGERYPDSVFTQTAPVLLANAHMQQNDGQGALKVLAPLTGSAEASHVDFQYALGRAYQMAGDVAHAGPVFRNIYLTQPLVYEAPLAATQLQAMGVPLTAAERKTHADALFNAKRYGEASAEYNAIGKNNPQLSAADRNGLTIYAAVCDFKLKHLSRRDIEKLPETNDDTAALKLICWRRCRAARTIARGTTH